MGQELGSGTQEVWLNTCCPMKVEVTTHPVTRVPDLCSTGDQAVCAQPTTPQESTGFPKIIQKSYRERHCLKTRTKAVCGLSESRVTSKPSKA